jgi:hypothetical protein
MNLLAVIELVINPTPQPHNTNRIFVWYGVWMWLCLIVPMLAALWWGIKKSYPFFKYAFYWVVYKVEDFFKK